MRRLKVELLEARIALTIDHSIPVGALSNLTIGRWTALAADLDGDGDADLVSASELRGGMAWHENIDGAGNFGARRPLPGRGVNARNVQAADVDGDQDLDLVLVANFHGASRVAWYENLGSGDFAQQQVIDESPDTTETLEVVDLDGDGDVDVIAAVGYFLDENFTTRFELVWYQNADGQGNFQKQQVVMSSDQVPLWFAVADIDVDGDLDVVPTFFGGDLAFVPQFFGNDHLYWYENTDGLGAFGLDSATNATLGDAHLFAADMDLDGDTDLLSMWRSLPPFETLESRPVQWVENASGAFQRAATIAGIDNFVADLFVLDIDGDGDQDLLSAHVDFIAWHENLGMAEFAERKLFSEVRSYKLYAADINGDGYVDIISSHEGVITWHEVTLTPMNDVFSVIRGETLTVDAPALLENDGLRAITVQVESDTQHGSLAWSPDGPVVYTPNVDYVGPDAFTYRTVDADGRVSEEAAVVAITVDHVPGDSNNDGIVDFIDFETLAANFGSSSVSRTEGDFDGDGRVTFEDFVILANRFET